MEKSNLMDKVYTRLEQQDAQHQGSEIMDKAIPVPLMPHQQGASVLSKHFQQEWPDGVEGVHKFICSYCKGVCDTAIALQAHIVTVHYDEKDDSKKEVSPKHPHYYSVIDDKDMYDLFLAHYGEEAMLKHLEMECLQYLWRCRSKGDSTEYIKDIQKVHNITDRILKILGP